MTEEELTRRFTYHPPKDNQTDRYQTIRACALEMATMLNAACPDSREKFLAITRLEDAVMWANAAIARNE